MTIPLAYAASARTRRNAPSLPFGWGAATVLLIGAVLLILGIVLILYGFFGLITNTISNATSSNFSVISFFNSFFGAIILFVIGGVLAGVGGWLVRLWWIFLLVGVVTGSGSTGNTAADRGAIMVAPEVKVRCRMCGHLNPQEARFCLACGQAI
jgi:hypothetical protein